MREGSNDPVLGVEKTHEGSSILKLSCSGVEQTCEELNDLVLGVAKTREGSSILKLSCSGVERLGFLASSLGFLA